MSNIQTGSELTTSELDLIEGLNALPVSGAGEAIQKTGVATFDNVAFSPLTTKGDLYTHSMTGNARLPMGPTGYALTVNPATSTGLQWAAVGTGTVTSVSVATANGISGTVTNPLTTPEITLVLAAITPTSVNGASATEIGYLMGVTSAIQTQLNGKEPTITTAGVNTVWHGNKVFSAVVEADMTLSDNTTNNVSTLRHGFMSKLPGTTTIFYRGDGTFAAPASVTVPNAYVIQAFTNTTYNLIHNLGAYPIVQVLDSTGAVVIPLSIVNNTANDLTVTFTTSGTYTIIATLGSPQLQSYVSTAVDYSALVTDRIIEVTGANKTVTLPTANVSNVGYVYIIDNSSGGSTSVVGQGGETIQGQASQQVPSSSSMSVYANGTVWRII